jgi:hypothetical protein
MMKQHTLATLALCALLAAILNPGAGAQGQTVNNVKPLPPIWREVAAGLEEGLGRKPVIVYHPQGGRESSSVYLHQEPWLSVNGMQSKHGGGHDLPVWEWIARDYAMTPAKPTLDLEPNYEDHPYNPWPDWDPANGYFRDYDVRKQVYRSVFAGACGVTYGHHAVWSFANEASITPIETGSTECSVQLEGRCSTCGHWLNRGYSSRAFPISL